MNKYLVQTTTTTAIVAAVFAESEEEAIAKEGEITAKQVTVSKSAVKTEEDEK